MKRAVRCLLAAPVLLIAAGPIDPDWPCVQRLVPSLTAATLWPGPPPKGDWRRDKRIAELVSQVADRRLPVDDAAERLERFVATRPGAEGLTEVFNGLVDQSNVERGRAIERLHAVARRERTLAQATGRVTTELNALPADAPAPQREETTNRRALMIREYDEVGRTIRYACEIPVDFEARLGRFAQILQAGLSN